MTRCRRVVALVLGAAGLVAPIARAAPASPLSQERESQRAAILVERRDTNARFEAQKKVCQSQFVVSACLNDAMKAQRVALHDLRQRELTLGEAERHDAAVARERAVAAKAAKAASQPESIDTAPVRPAHARTPPKPTPLVHPKPVAIDQRAGEEAQVGRRVREERSEAAFAAKSRAAAEHREAVLRRNAERASAGKVAAPLPKAASEP